MKELGFLKELDFKILKELYKNGRATYVELKRKLGVEDTTIRKRILKMEKEGIIEGYTVKINPEALGYTITSFIGIKSEPKLTEYVAKKVSEVKGVFDVFVATGPYDMIVYVICKNMSELGDIVSMLKKIEGVEQVDVNIAVKWIKKNGNFIFGYKES